MTDHLMAAGVEIAYNEVTLTRRVFRDGTSEYFLNKTPCRLKDIQQLFHGHGGGTIQLQHHGAGKYHADLVVQAGGSADDF